MEANLLALTVGILLRLIAPALVLILIGSRVQHSRVGRAG
jgi:hypothetical protein